MRAGTTLPVLSPQGAFTIALQNKTSRFDRLRLRILAAARRADLVAMHDYIVTYHQLLGIEEGEPDRAGKAPAPNKGATHIDVRASRRRKG